jgi:GAF domain-containing protein
MFVHPHLSGQVARERQRDMLATAEQQRLIRQLRAASRESRHAATPGHRVRTRIRSAAVRLRPALRA